MPRASPRRCCSARPTGPRPACAVRPTTPSDLFVRGCVTHPSAAEAFLYDLHGTKGQDPRVIQAKALADTIPIGW
jgi:hypothetical protein